MTLLVALGGVWVFEFIYARSLARGLRFKTANCGTVGRRLATKWKNGLRFIPRAGCPRCGCRLRIIRISSAMKRISPRASPVIPRMSGVTSYVCARRGAFRLGPTSISTGTPFGMYLVEFEYAASDSVIVMPPVVPLPEITVAPGGRAYRGRRRASTFERTVSVFGSAIMSTEIPSKQFTGGPPLMQMS